MSYTILYRAMFVKLSGDKYIPMIESGDNNVWECDNRRRARSWCHARWIMKSKTEYAFTADEIMKGVEAMIDSVKARYVGNERPDYDRRGEGVYTDKEIENRFGWFDGISVYSKGTTNTTAQQIRNFFKKGIVMAATLDDIRLDVHWCPKYPNYEHRYVSTEEKLAAAFRKVWIQGLMYGLVSLALSITSMNAEKPRPPRGVRQSSIQKALQFSVTATTF